MQWYIKTVIYFIPPFFNFFELFSDDFSWILSRQIFFIIKIISSKNFAFSLLFLFLILIRDIFIALEMIFVIRFPWVFTNIAKVFATPPSPAIAIHEIASHRSLHSLPTRGTNFRIYHNPFYICIIFFDHNFPFFYLFAHRGFMIAVFTFKAKFRFALARDVLFSPIFILYC